MNKDGYRHSRNLILALVGSLAFSFGMAQRIYLDTVRYEGILKFKKVDIQYKRIKSVTASLKDNFRVYDPEPNSEDETLLLFDKGNNCILNFKFNEVLVDHNSATFMTTECLITDSSLLLTRYSYWSGECYGCEIGIEHFTYGINNFNLFYLKDSSSAFTYDSKQKLKLSKSDSNRFRQLIIKSPFLNDMDRKKIYKYLN